LLDEVVYLDEDDLLIRLPTLAIVIGEHESEAHLPRVTAVKGTQTMECCGEVVLLRRAVVGSGWERAYAIGCQKIAAIMRRTGCGL
jgi:hypothetical protein